MHAAQAVAALATWACAACVEAQQLDQHAVVLNVSATARYGHSAVYDDSSNSVVFLGGQAADPAALYASGEAAEVAIAADALVLDLAEAYMPYARSAVSVGLNPSSDESWSLGTTSRAWAALAKDDKSGILASFGGVTADCLGDNTTLWTKTASEADKTEWQGFVPSSGSLQRRRQAAMVVDSASLYLFGGFAETYSCASDSVAYRAHDVVDLASGAVATYDFDELVNAHLAVSDFAATHIDGAVLFFGGQHANGTFASLSEAVVYNLTTQTWRLEVSYVCCIRLRGTPLILMQSLTGSIPSPRIGHATAALSDTSLLVHGGLAANGSVLSDAHVLERTRDSWAWQSASLVDDSGVSASLPARAWHTLTSVDGALWVLAFGLDGETNAPADSVVFITANDDSTLAWSESYAPSDSAVRLRRRWQRQRRASHAVVPNPKAALLSSTARSAAVESSSSSAASSEAWAQPATAQTTTTLTVADASASPASQSVNDNVADTTETKKVVAATTVGGLGAFAALIAVAMLARKVRRSRRGAQSLSDGSGGGMEGIGSAPFVSQLVFTRPASSRASDTDDSSVHATPRVSSWFFGGGADAASSSASSSGSSTADPHSAYADGASSRAADPFGDEHAQVADEHGVMREGSFSDYAASSVASTVASAVSYPYLTAIARTGSYGSAADDRRQLRATVASPRPEEDGLGEDKLTSLPSRRSTRRGL